MRARKTTSQVRKRTLGAFARPKRDGARRGRENFQQKIIRDRRYKTWPNHNPHKLEKKVGLRAFNLRVIVEIETTFETHSHSLKRRRYEP